MRVSLWQEKQRQTSMVLHVSYNRTCWNVGFSFSTALAMRSFHTPARQRTAAFMELFDMISEVG